MNIENGYERLKAEKDIRWLARRTRVTPYLLAAGIGIASFNLSDNGDVDLAPTLLAVVGGAVVIYGERHNAKKGCDKAIADYASAIGLPEEPGFTTVNASVDVDGSINSKEQADGRAGIPREEYRSEWQAAGLATGASISAASAAIIRDGTGIASWADWGFGISYAGVAAASAWNLDYGARTIRDASLQRLDNIDEAGGFWHS